MKCYSTTWWLHWECTFVDFQTIFNLSPFFVCFIWVTFLSFHFVWTYVFAFTQVNFLFITLSLGSSRPRLRSASVCAAVGPPVCWRCSITQAPEQSTLRTPSSESPRASHTSPTTTAQHTTTGEAQTADTPGQGRNTCAPFIAVWDHTWSPLCHICIKTDKTGCL